VSASETSTPKTNDYSSGRLANRDEALPRLDVGILIALGAIKLLLHLFTSVRHYGYFRDELYYLDMGRHLDWGYVDAAPMVGIYAKIALMMGGSLAALRIIPALAGVALIALTMLIARELGRGRYAKLLAGVCALLCPAVLVMNNFLSMNASEPLFWMGCIWVVTRIFAHGELAALDLVWSACRSGAGEQTLHVVFWICGHGGIATYASSPGIYSAMDLDCRRNCRHAFSAEPGLAGSASLPNDRRSGQRAARGQECGARSHGVR
jgi:hypothetical protein